MDKLLTYLADIGVYPDTYKVSGDSLLIPCPFAHATHEKGKDNKPSFSITPSKGMYNCYSCEMSGMLYNLPVKLNEYGYSISAAKAAKFVKSISSFTPERVEIESTSIQLKLKTWDALYNELPQRAINYIEGRGVTLEACEKLHVKYCKKRDLIVIPVVYDGIVKDYSGRYINPKGPKIYTKPDSKISEYILGSHLWVEGKPVLLFEGLFGYLLAHSKGFDSHFNIGSTFSANLSQAQAEILLSFEHSVYVMFDNDEAGRKAIFGTAKSNYDKSLIAKIGGKLPVFIPDYSEFCYDSDDLNLEELLELKKYTLPYSGD